MKKQEMLDAIRKRNELTGRRNLFARFGCHKSENGYELCQAFNADGKEVWIERDNWRGMIGTWATCCDAPNGYCERDCSLADDIDIVLCDQGFNPIGIIESNGNSPYATKPLIPYETVMKQETQKMRDKGIIPEGCDTNANSKVLKPMWEADDRGECYFENCLYCRWHCDKKAEVVYSFSWFGIKCYVQKSGSYHDYMPVRSTCYRIVTYNMSLWHTIGYITEIDTNIKRYYGASKPYNHTSSDASLLLGFNKEFSNGDKRSVTVEKSGRFMLRVPTIKKYVDWCKLNGLRAVECQAGEYKYTRHCGFDIKHINSDSMPDDFKPIAVMRNGVQFANGGFKVEDNVLYAWLPPFDAIWESADSWEERVQFENQNILLCA